MKRVAVSVVLYLLTGCAATTWSVKNVQDEFTDKRSCKVIYGSDFGRDFVKASGGIHYYPFIEKMNDEIIFGVHNDYNVPVGDIQIRVDNNDPVLISYSETPVSYTATNKAVDLSYLKGVEGINQEAMQSSIEASMKNISKMSSPFTATSGEKAKQIISQLKAGQKMKMRVIGFGTNSIASTTGEFELGESLRASLAACGI